MTSLDPAAGRAAAPLSFGGPLTMLTLCLCGMATGLAIDLQSVLPATVATLCLGGHSFVGSLLGHASLLPATNLFMLASGLIAIGLGAPARAGSGGPAGLRSHLVRGLACNAAMFAGMALAQWLGPEVATGLGLSWSLSAMMGAMAAGMALGATAVGLPAVLRRARPFRPAAGRAAATHPAAARAA